MSVSERECVWVCMTERERESVCVHVRERERERERECVCACEREREREAHLSMQSHSVYHPLLSKTTDTGLNHGSTASSEC